MKNKNMREQDTPLFQILSTALGALASAVDDAQEAMDGITPEASDVQLAMSRLDGVPTLHHTLFNDGCEVIASYSVSFDRFLDETTQIYMCGGPEWLDNLIEDLELLKLKIQERIDKVKADVAAEQD